jgi:hypothetical protein
MQTGSLFSEDLGRLQKGMIIVGSSIELGDPGASGFDALMGQLRKVTKRGQFPDDHSVEEYRGPVSKSAISID